MAKNAALKLFSFGKKRDVAPSDEAGQHNIESAAKQAAAESASLAERDRVLGESLDLFENDVLRVVRSMSEGISEVQDKSVLASERLSDVKGAIHTLGDASERVNVEVSGIAQSAEELTLAANEISDTVGQVRELTSATMDSATESARDIEGLGAAVGEIGTLLTSIGEIATRTNLLALNATIEAARAGEAGRGFAVVAQEVKALSVAAAQSVSAIRQRMEALQASSDRAIGGMKRICKEISEVTPICSTIAQAAEEQRQTIVDLADRMGKAQMAVNGINDSVRTINTMTAEAFDISSAAGAQSAVAAGEAQSLGRRVVTILRTMSAANRRKFDRYPIDLALRVKVAGDLIACRSFDISEGGLLIKAQDKLSMNVGTTYDAEISQVGTARLRVANVTPMGTHCAFHEISAEAQEGLSKVIATFQKEHEPLVVRAQDFATELQTAIEADIRQGKLSLSAVFDTDYKKIVGSNPAQFTTEYLERFDAILPAIMERTLKIDPQMVYCLPIDRNGYIPVHNQKYSQKPKPDDVAWNIANCRNRRIFDDRTALLAARLMRPSLVQTYNRDMGNGTLIPMKEVDVPLVIMGRHWGGIRMAYSL